MFKLIGSVLVFLSGYSLQYGFELSLVLWFLFGLFLIFFLKQLAAIYFLCIAKKYGLGIEDQ